MISIIVPIYNVEAYLRECVESVQNQTYRDLEIILVDDGSPDACGDICDEYAARDSRVTVIHKENGGLSDARNAGLSIAQGKYVYFLDSDDYIKNDTIEKLVVCAEGEDADIVFFDSETLYENHEDSDYRECFIRNNVYQTDKGINVLEAQFQNNEYFSPVPFLLIRKKFLEQQSLCFVKNMMHEDELFTLIAFVRAERVAQLKGAYYVRRLRANSIMSGKTSIKSIDGVLQCIDGFLNEGARYTNDSKEWKIIVHYTEEMVNRFISKYSEIDCCDRKCLKPQVKQLKRLMAKVKYLGKFKVWLKMHCFRLLLYYRRLFKRS